MYGYVTMRRMLFYFSFPLYYSSDTKQKFTKFEKISSYSPLITGAAFASSSSELDSSVVDSSFFAGAFLTGTFLAKTRYLQSICNCKISPFKVAKKRTVKRFSLLSRFQVLPLNNEIKRIIIPLLACFASSSSELDSSELDSSFLTGTFFPGATEKKIVYSTSNKPLLLVKLPRKIITRHLAWLRKLNFAIIA